MTKQQTNKMLGIKMRIEELLENKRENTSILMKAKNQWIAITFWSWEQLRSSETYNQQTGPKVNPKDSINMHSIVTQTGSHSICNLLNTISNTRVINIKIQETILPICINVLLLDWPKYFLSFIDLLIMSKLNVPTIWQNSGRTSRNNDNPKENWLVSSENPKLFKKLIPDICWATIA